MDGSLLGFESHFVSAHLHPVEGPQAIVRHEQTTQAGKKRQPQQLVDPIAGQVQALQGRKRAQVRCARPDRRAVELVRGQVESNQSLLSEPSKGAGARQRANLGSLQYVYSYFNMTEPTETTLQTGYKIAWGGTKNSCKMNKGSYHTEVRSMAPSERRFSSVIYPEYMIFLSVHWSMERVAANTPTAGDDATDFRPTHAMGKKNCRLGNTDVR